MLQIKQLTITHKKDLRVILKDFSFVLNPGDKVVLIGEEGNGKSTLLKWIYDPRLIEGYAETQGERICTGEHPGYLPQELPAEEKEKTVYEYFCGEDAFGMQTSREVTRLAGQLKLPSDFFYQDQKMNTLSGGEKVKAQMARLLMTQPSVLLLDEPSNDIDIETLEWLEKLILEAPQPVLFISHDETLIERTANVVIHIEQLKRKTESRYSVAKTGYRQYEANRAAQLASQEQRALGERREEKKRQEKFQRIEQAVNYDLNSITRQNPHGGYLLKKKMRAVKSLEKRYEREALDRTEIPETEDAIFFKVGEKVKMPAGKTVLEFSLDRLYAPSSKEEAPRLLSEHIFLRIKGGERVCITGKNGVGKTTLLKQIAEQLLSRTDIRACYMPQNYEDLLELDRTPVDFLSVTGDKEETTRIRTYLGSMKYTVDEMTHPMSELSGGQKAKVLLLKMSLSGADVLILDEPTRNFSPLSGPVIRKILRQYQGAILSISHDRKYIEEVCTAVYQLTPEGLVKSAGENV
ncbi:ATP-binding cassette domain-containing protein [Hungatella effluvii]|uniref:ATP-binding cassette domain-containing protein n=1 Tax=Hungatella effluvii TaxID=1096246 RepID=UPI0022E6CA16|nr:ATP-binding cassette domain-containing protein [Hungatella effluvii]